MPYPSEVIPEGDRIDTIIALSLAEDIGDGDHSTLSCIPRAEEGEMQLLVKQQGVLAGMAIAPRVFQAVDDAIRYAPLIPDGAQVAPGDLAFRVQGPVHSLLRAERVVLNIMQRMSGVATHTRAFVEAVAGTDARILDTRKTTPGMRPLDKMAVRIGGGVNHRIGLFDMIMLKDNHIDFAGGVALAIERAKAYLRDTGRSLDIVVEARSLPDVEIALRVGGVRRILLDNFSIPQTQKAIALIDGRVEAESSGRITLRNVRAYAETGVDYLSIGALTHQAQGLDMSLKKC